MWRLGGVEAGCGVEMQVEVDAGMCGGEVTWIGGGAVL